MQNTIPKEAPLTLDDLRRMENAMHASMDRFNEYRQLPLDRQNADVAKSLEVEYRRKAKAWNVARKLVYTVLWADPEW